MAITVTTNNQKNQTGLNVRIFYIFRRFGTVLTLCVINRINRPIHINRIPFCCYLLSTRLAAVFLLESEDGSAPKHDFFLAEIRTPSKPVSDNVKEMKFAEIYLRNRVHQESTAT